MSVRMRGGAFVCSICGQKSTGYPNNAEPVVKNGWCCDNCNVKTVMTERIRLLSDTLNRGQS